MNVVAFLFRVQTENKREKKKIKVGLIQAQVNTIPVAYYLNLVKM